MEPYLSKEQKFDLQQNYRRFLKHQESYKEENALLNAARASRLWMVALVCLLFALASDFFLGAATALFCLYFFRVGMAWYHRAQSEEARDKVERWFHIKGYSFQGRVLYSLDDSELDYPLDPFEDAHYR